MLPPGAQLPDRIGVAALSALPVTESHVKNGKRIADIVGRIAL